MKRSLMLTYWEGGGAPSGSKTMTYQRENTAELRILALSWIDAVLAGADTPDADDEDDLRIHDVPRLEVTDLPIAIWDHLVDGAA